MKSIRYFTIILVSVLFSILSYSQSKTHIACVGNSINYGSKIENREINSYPAQLGKLLGENFEWEISGKAVPPCCVREISYTMPVMNIGSPMRSL